MAPGSRLHGSLLRSWPSNPLTVEPDALADIEVVMTMVGGTVEYCGAEAAGICIAQP